jgi:hypothetical protein
VTIKYCRFVNNTAANDDGNDVYANFTSDFFNNPNNVANDCTVSFPPQLVVGGVIYFFFLKDYLLLISFRWITVHVFPQVVQDMNAPL